MVYSLLQVFLQGPVHEDHSSGTAELVGQPSTHSACTLHKAIDDISEFCKKWKLKVNSNETKVSVFG